MAEAWGWNKILSEKQLYDYKKRLLSRSLTIEETERYIENMNKMRQFIIEDKEKPYIIHLPSTIISFGVK